MARILGLGDNVCDIYENLGMMYPGGQALNVAVFSAMVGAQSEYMGTFGTDDVADCVQEALRARGVPFPRARTEHGPNGCALVRLEKGDRVFAGSNRGGVARLHPLIISEEDARYIRSFDVVHTSNNSWLDGQIAALDAGSTAVSYDFSGKWKESERVARICPHIDYAFISCGSLPMEEVRAQCGALRAAGASVVVATRGGQGAYYLDGRGEVVQAPAWVKPVDTLGAGDSFAASLLVSFAHLKKPPMSGIENRALVRAALKSAAEFAAQRCLEHGAFGHGRAVTRQRVLRAVSDIARWR